MRSPFQTNAHDRDRFDGRPDAPRRHPLRELDNLARVERYDLDQLICREAGSMENCYRIVSGAACRTASRADGSRRTVDLLVPDDYFGFCVADDQGLTIEAAVDETIVSIYPRWCVEFLAEVDPAIREALSALELDAISRTRRHLSANRRMTTANRLVAFLIEMNRRVSFDDPHGFELPASLDRIADYLEITTPTIERHLTYLRELGAIARRGQRKFRILDFRLLASLERVHLTPGFNPQFRTFEADLRGKTGGFGESSEPAWTAPRATSLH
jgi:CRP/FNR family transcriptional regulator, nitrogen fixation regulation protein